MVFALLCRKKLFSDCASDVVVDGGRAYRHRSTVALSRSLTISAVIVATLWCVVPATSIADEIPLGLEPAVRIPVNGPIGPMFQQFLFRRLEQAKEDGVKLIILEIDSPGGLLDASIAIADKFLDIDWAKIVAYVPREALSGAAIAALGCDEIVMAPDAKLGDAGPILMDEYWMFQHAEEKIVSHLAVEMRRLAEASGRPPALAEAMVNRNLVVYEVTNRDSGETEFLSDAEIESLANPQAWEKQQPVFESRPDHFLEVTGTRAVELGLAEATVDSLQGLMERYGLKQEPRLMDTTWVDDMVYYLNLWWVTGLLLIVGLICFYIELHVPGIGIGALLGILCFAIFFWSRFLGGTAGWLEVTLFAAGVACLGLEIFVIPGFGVSGVTGLLLILVSLVLAGQTFILPSTTGDMRVLTRSLGVIVASAIAFMIVAAIVGRRFHALPLFGRIVLTPPEEALRQDSLAPAVVAVAAETLVGKRGVAHTALRPAGKARFGDEFINVFTDGDFIRAGTQIEVIEHDDHRVLVRAV